ncbi:MAG: hypothetical protein C0624_03770 [Desulfuromonas sp.]|nr:MAG: hypothetical protein C0624_03770 [Desulfuromonas sp.]
MVLNRFKWRSFVSLVLTASALVMLVSGLVIYVMPEGRIAYWNDWRLLTLDKEQWGAIHTLTSLLFTGFAVWHLVYNWKIFLAYLRDKAGQLWEGRRELVAALLVTLVFTAGSAAGVVPFQPVMDFGKFTKSLWYRGEDVVPPFPHAELMTLKQLAGKMQLNLDGVQKVLVEQGLEGVSPDAQLKVLAQGSSRSPGQIFEQMMMDDRVY